MTAPEMGRCQSEEQAQRLQSKSLYSNPAYWELVSVFPPSSSLACSRLLSLCEIGGVEAVCLSPPGV
ncbi:hypothetical protein chiPu_0013188 [Chiloscyllium punctatum]|uniref:Uncharacterized protein n=1 Tax=Chiloscyllium punctatum TaxID=137246 RepID=A0A401SWF7_CHIPU|nr:hypothetical protein [Chiloscyllium punctatum]